MVKWMVMLALATGQAPPPGAPAVAPEAPPPAAAPAPPASPAPEGAQAEARKRADEVKEALGPQAQPFPANGNVASSACKASARPRRFAIASAFFVPV